MEVDRTTEEETSMQLRTMPIQRAVTAVLPWLMRCVHGKRDYGPYKNNFFSELYRPKFSGAVLACVQS